MHKKLIEGNLFYRVWHELPHISAVHLFILIGLASWATAYVNDQILESSQLANVATSHQQAPELHHASLGQLTSEMLKLSKQFAEANTPEEKAPIMNALTATVLERRDLLMDLAKSNPNEFLLQSLPQGLVDKLPEAIKPLLEQDMNVSGVLTARHIDYFDEKKSEFEYELETDSGRRYNLRAADGQIHDITGARITVSGKALGQELVLAYAGGSSYQTTSTAIANGPTGVQKTLVMLVNFTDNLTQSYTPTQVAGIMFTNPDSLSAYYQTDSFDQISFSGDVTPWFTVPYTISTICSSWTTITNAAQTAAANMGYRLSDYSRMVLVIPNAGCGWGGFSTIGGSPSVSVSIEYGQPYFVQILEHELGHALGQHHASTRLCGGKSVDSYANCSWSEYGENYDPLGYYNSNGSNPAHKALFGWLAASNIQTVSSSGTYTVAPIETKTTDPQVIKIYKADTNEYYYVGYRQQVGQDSNVPAGIADGVVIHTSPGSGVNTAWLDMTPGDGNYTNAALKDGQTFSDPANGLSIQQMSHNSAGATLNITIAAAPCAPGVPSMTLTPSSQFGAPGSTLKYTVSLTNTDSKTCSSSIFQLSSVVPDAWTGSYSPTSLTLAPGASGSATLSVTSDAAAAIATYGITSSVADGGASSHNVSRVASYVVYDPSIDSTPPTVRISAPKGGKLKGTDMLISASAADVSGIESITLDVDGAVVKTCTAVGTCDSSVKIASLSKGQHVITATAKDASSSANTGSVSVMVVK